MYMYMYMYIMSLYMYNDDYVQSINHACTVPQPVCSHDGSKFSAKVQSTAIQVAGLLFGTTGENIFSKAIYVGCCCCVYFNSQTKRADLPNEKVANADRKQVYIRTQI